MYVALRSPRAGTDLIRKRVSVAPWELTGCPMTYFTIKPAKARYIATWPTKGEISFALLDSDGNLMPPGEIKTPGRNGMRTGILALSALDGSNLIAWKNNEQLGWQLYDRRGIPKGEPQSTHSAGKGAAGVTLRNGTFLLFP